MWRNRWGCRWRGRLGKGSGSPLKSDWPHDPVSPLFGINARDMKTSPCSIKRNGWTMWSGHTMKYYSAMKRNEVPTHVTTWKKPSKQREARHRKTCIIGSTCMNCLGKSNPPKDRKWISSWPEQGGETDRAFTINGREGAPWLIKNVLKLIHGNRCMT